MRGSSLATRLFLSATAWVVVILVITGVDSVVGLSRRDRARLRPPPQPLSPHPDRRSRDPGRAARPSVPVARRAAVRTAAVRLVLADHPHRSEKAETRASRSLWDKKLPKLEEHRRGADRRRHPSRLCRRSRGPEPADGGAAGRPRRRRQIPGQRGRRRQPRFSTKPAASIITSAAPSRRSASCCC